MKLIDYVFPKQCLICSKIGEDICNHCLKGLTRTLPSCCICNKLSNNYLTHTNCLNSHIQCFTGWYLTKDIQVSLLRKKTTHLYSVYELLFNNLITYLKIGDFINSSHVYPVPSENKDDFLLNNHMSRKIAKKANKETAILFVGEYLPDIQNVINKTKGLSIKEPLSIHILVLFKPIPA